jgi:hypothetical protein
MDPAPVLDHKEARHDETLSRRCCEGGVQQNVVRAIRVVVRGAEVYSKLQQPVLRNLPGVWCNTADMQRLVLRNNLAGKPVRHIGKRNCVLGESVSMIGWLEVSGHQERRTRCR